jgi:two-component system, chemotaxis family, CheB/CheR fusion protein
VTDRSPVGRPPDGAASTPAESGNPSRSCVVVGIGASAGGLEAFSALLEQLPLDTGMAFVFLQHLDPHHPSLLTHLLSAKTAMNVTEVTDGLRVAADHVYVIPPDADMEFAEGRIKLTPRHDEAGHHLPIDAFLRSLAADLGESSCGVILSGAASDGAQGLAAVKSAGGVTFAQEPASAGYPSMPAAAIAARAVDFVLPPREIAAELARLGADPRLTGAATFPADASGSDDDGLLKEIFALLYDAFEVDFSAYKLPTVRRRLARRVLLSRSADLGDYVTRLRSEPAEIEGLYRDILIMVTEFFRDPETFAALRELVLPELLERKADGDPLRIWVPGCASGEEAYSLAIAVLDAMADQGRDFAVKIFATDINEPDLRRARRGVYAHSVAAQVPPDLLRRYFVATDDGYKVAKAVRDLCVFARHDVTADPPFPRLDLVSCRNLLIYLGPALQRRVIPSLHYGIVPGGYLVLGRSESLGGAAQLFEAVDKKHKVFKKIPAAAGAGAAFPARVLDEATHRPTTSFAAAALAFPAAKPSVRERADAAVLAGFAPAGVTVDARNVIVEFRGDTSPYLANRAGRASLNLLDMIRDDLAGDVRAALADAARTGTTVVLEGLHVSDGDGGRTIDLHAIPFDAGGAPHYVVLFGETARPPRPGGPANAAAALEKAAAAPAKADDLRRLRDELNATRERLEAVVSDKEAVNEELRAANEEMLSSGEEMQSVNEELETTHEELQSTNQELRARNDELAQVGDDLTNLLASVSFPIIMVDRDLRIRRFTPAAERLFKVIPGDVGRPITDLRLPIDVDDLAVVLGGVIASTTLREREVQDDEGRWYIMQVRPYETVDRRIDGAVMTLFDVDELTRRYEVQRHIALTLQENFLHPLPAIAGLELGWVSRAAFEPELVGGDFSDIFVIDDTHVVALIGDVAGKGVKAAGHTQTVRSKMRAFATIDPSPAFVLERTNDLLIKLNPDDPHVTAFCAVLDPRTGRMSYASAGHPAPVRLGAAACGVLDVAFGPPLGSFGHAFVDSEIVLDRNDSLVLYTDGVTEARQGVRMFGEPRLLDAVADLRGRPAQAVADGVAEAARAFGGRLRDDLQVVVLRLT